MAKMKSIKKDGFVTKGYLDKALKEYSATIIEAVNFGFEKNKKEHEEFKDRMDKLVNTLDKFLKHLMDFNDEFKIVKARLAKVEKILEEKLGIVID